MAIEVRRHVLYSEVSLCSSVHAGVLCWLCIPRLREGYVCIHGTCREKWVSGCQVNYERGMYVVQTKWSSRLLNYSLCFSISL